MNAPVHSDDARFLELLERWLSGEFTRSEERELYALAAADPFRQEAWKGFAALPAHQHQVQLARLRQRLHGHTGGGRIPVGMWLAAAASLLLLLAAVYFFPKTQSPETASRTVSTPESQTLPAPTGASGGDIAIQEKQTAGRAATAKQPSGSVAGDARSTVADMAEEMPKTAPPAGVFDAGPPRAKDLAPVQVGGPENNLQNMPQYPVAGGPAANAVLKKEPTRSLPPQTEKATGDAQPPDPERRSAASEQPSPVTPAVSGEPAGGWDNFHQYLRRTARLSNAARNNNISGNVRLQFTAGPDGKPVNVKVVQSLGYGCDEEALRLIRLFDWGPPGAGPILVEVPFVR